MLLEGRCIAAQVDEHQIHPDCTADLLQPVCTAIEGLVVVRAGTSDVRLAGKRAVQSVSPGMIWAPDETWAEELIEECAAFPNGEYDDLVDSTTQALMRYRQGNFVQLPSDDWDTPEPSQIQYYG